MNHSISESLFEESKKLMPGGVNSPVRAYNGIGQNPPFIEKAKGSHIFDVDGNEYIDYVLSFGPMILGHAHESVIKTVVETINKGLSFGSPCALESILAKMVMELVPSVKMIRMVNSGTEATMSAIRAARGFTNRDIIIKFEGCYHGHSDSLLIKSGSGMLTCGSPSSKGIPSKLANSTFVLSYNDIDSVKYVFEKIGEKIAGVIVEPVAGNMGTVLASKEFLNVLSEETKKYGSLLIFDEVMTGFRVDLHCAQNCYGIKPDLTTFGKIIGGGLPVGAYGGRLDVMSEIAPLGPIYQAGTLSGNPVTMSSGIATLKELILHPEYYTQIENYTKILFNGIKEEAKLAGIPLVFNQMGSMGSVFFTEGNVSNLEDVKKSNLEHFRKYFIGMLKEGVYLPASQFESIFLSVAHTYEDIEKTINAAKKVFKNF